MRGVACGATGVTGGTGRVGASGAGRFSASTGGGGEGVAGAAGLAAAGEAAAGALGRVAGRAAALEDSCDGGEGGNNCALNRSGVSTGPGVVILLRSSGVCHFHSAARWTRSDIATANQMTGTENASRGLYVASIWSCIECRGLAENRTVACGDIGHKGCRFTLSGCVVSARPNTSLILPAARLKVSTDTTCYRHKK
jgi:hypothetical protein